MLYRTHKCTCCGERLRLGNPPPGYILTCPKCNAPVQGVEHQQPKGLFHPDAGMNLLAVIGVVALCPPIGLLALVPGLLNLWDKRTFWIDKPALPPDEPRQPPLEVSGNQEERGQNREWIVSCATCGARVRIRSIDANRRAICPKCKSAL